MQSVAAIALGLGVIVFTNLAPMAQWEEPPLLPTPTVTTTPDVPSGETGP